MHVLARVWQRCVSLFRKRALDADFDEEARTHIALATDDYVQRGVPRSEAQRLARLKFGSLTAAKDAHRDSRGLAWLDGVLFDLRMALRTLRRDRGYTTTALVMLTAALALNATVFTVMDAMLFRGFPLVSRNDRIAYVQERCGGAICGLSYADFEVWRAEARSFESLSFLGTRLIALRDGDGRFADLSARIVSANTFRMLGVAPLLGRDFADEDEAEGAPPTTVLSHRFWQERYGGRPEVIGSTVQIDGAPTVIIGVMPRGFEFTSESPMWLPVVRSRTMLRRGATAGSHVAVGRLRDGVSMQVALAELEAINHRLAVTYPETNRERMPRAYTHAQFISGPDAPMIWGSLWVGSCLVLLIACANLANLTLVRTIGRWREFVTTMALGAGQARMIRRVAIESLLLTGAVVPVAWTITQWAVRRWSVATASPHQILDYTVDARVFGYLVVVAAVALVLFSLAPMLRVRRLSVSGALKSDARGVTQSPFSRHLSSGLVAVQMALAIVLLSGAGILVRSIVNITGADTGLRDTDRVLVGMLRMPSLKFPDAQRRFAYLERMESELRTIPGIAAASLSASIPTKGGTRRAVEIQGQSTASTSPVTVVAVAAGAEYFDVLATRPLAGRVFNRGDRADSTPVALVNETFAAQVWPGELAVGQYLRFIERDGAGAWRTVVGVVPTILEGDTLRQQVNPVVYTPFHQETPARAVYFLARSTGAPAIAPLVGRQLRTLDGDVALERFSTLEESFAFNRDSMDFEHSELGKHATVAPVFAGTALLLSSIGLVAVLSHSVGQRRKEIGIRMAVGAATRDVFRMITTEGMMPVAIGLVVGLTASAGANRLLQAQLVGVSPYDPLTLTAGAGLMIVVALVGCSVPAVQATRIEPVVALRQD